MHDKEDICGFASVRSRDAVQRFVSDLLGFITKIITSCLSLSMVLLPKITGGRSERVCECLQQGARAGRAQNWGFPERQLLPLLL